MVLVGLLGVEEQELWEELEQVVEEMLEEQETVVDLRLVELQVEELPVELQQVLEG